MATYAQQITRLRRIIAIAQKLIADLDKPHIGRPTKTNANEKAWSAKGRIRRSGKELVAFRKMLKTERTKGVPVGLLAKKHKVSLGYIYQL
jgi:hypothetical protein